MDDPGIDVNAQDEMGRTALILASWKGNADNVRLLLQNGADVLVGTRDGFTCLHMAAFRGHTEVINLLLHGKSPRARDCSDEWDPSLPCLSWRRRLALMDRRSTSEKFTALHLVACGDHGKGVAISGSILEAYKRSVLEIFGLASNPKVAYQIENRLWLDYLLQLRNELNVQDGEILNSQSILENMASYGNHGAGWALRKQLLEKYEGLVRSFLEVISYSNARDRIGRTALHYAAWENTAELIKFLTWDSQMGSLANVNAMDVDGHTPLHFASRNGCREAVSALLATDVIVIDVKDLELSSRQSQLVKKIYLRPNAGTKFTYRSEKIVSEIMLGEGQSQCPSTLLLPRLPDFVWAEDRADLTPLHYAVEKGHTDIVQLLVEHPQIEVFHRASDGQSPWTMAFLDLSHSKLPANLATRIQQLLRSGATISSGANVLGHQLYRQKLFKQAATLAVVADGVSEQSVDAAEQLSLLETQILVAFVEDIVEGPKEILRSILDESFQVKPQDGSSEKIMESILARASELRERFTLFHVGAFEGYAPELETLLTVKKYRECINDRESLTCAGYTALHLAILRSMVDTGGLAVLLNEKTMRPTEMNKKGQTPLQVLEHLLDKYSSSSKLKESLTDKTPSQLAEIQLGIRFPKRIRKKQKKSLGHKLKEMTALEATEYLLGITSVISGFGRLEEWRGSLRRTNTDGSEEVPKSLLSAHHLLMGRPEVRQCVEHLYKDREVHVNAANAILVGAALIATISYQAWDQPPAGTTGHYVYAILFQALNSLSFSSAIAGVLIAAAAALPSRGNSIQFQKQVRLVRNLFFVASIFLAFSIYFIMLSFFVASSRYKESKYTGNAISWIALLLILYPLQCFCRTLCLSVPSRGAQFAKFLGLFMMIVALAVPHIPISNSDKVDN